MSPDKQIIERRKVKRFKVCEGAFAVLKPNTTFSKIGNIIDISPAGMAFHCVDAQENELKTDGTNKMDIFMTGSGFVVDHIPFRVVSEVVLPKVIPFYSVVTRRLSIEFMDIPHRKRMMLENFMHKHVHHEAPPDTSA